MLFPPWKILPSTGKNLQIPSLALKLGRATLGLYLCLAGQNQVNNANFITKILAFAGRMLPPPVLKDSSKFQGVGCAPATAALIIPADQGNAAQFCGTYLASVTGMVISGIVRREFSNLQYCNY